MEAILNRDLLTESFQGPEDTGVLFQTMEVVSVLGAFEKLIYAFSGLFCLFSKFSKSVAPNCMANVYAHFKDNAD